MPAEPTSQYSITEQQMHAVLTGQPSDSWSATRVDWIHHRDYSPHPPAAER